MSDFRELDFVSLKQHKASTLVELLQRRASEHTSQSVYTFLADGSTGQLDLTFKELDMAARGLASALQDLNMRGERALLLYAPGLDFIVGFFGCLYAGVIAVPVYPPNPSQPARTIKRLQAIVADAGARVALTTSAILKKVEKLAEHAPELKLLHWLASDTIVNEKQLSGNWRDPEVTSQNLAFLQYTSGSTGAPKGVMITHQNLLHNAEMVYQAFSHNPTDKYVSWLPTFHDMGLMAGVLQPLYGGFPVFLMSPVSFLQNPFKWLQAISDYKATTSGGPNFAYDLCLRKISAEQRATLDLSSWTVAFNGAEPVRKETLERFAKMFEPCGFRKEALYPCYGLAEATLIVSGGLKTVGPITKDVETQALESHRVVEASQVGVEARSLVSCGSALIDEEIAIVHPSSLTRCLSHEVGEIWVRSSSVGLGYWNREAETTQTFKAYVADTREGPFLRTGDLGFLQNGELFIAGRHKDLIIIRGFNHYPQDIELTVERSHPALRAGCGAAFTVDVDGEERLVVAQEIDLSRHPDLEEVFAGMRQSVSENHELQISAIALLKPGSIPKTSSGKIQRRACRSGFIKGELEEIERNTLKDEAAEEELEESFIRRALLSAEMSKRQPLMEAYLLEQISPILKVKVARLRSNQSLASFGLDSLMAVELKNRIEVDLKLTVPLTAFLQESGVAQLANTLLEQLNEPVVFSSSSPLPVAMERPFGDQPLSYVQQSIWFLHQLAPELAAYNVTFAARIRSEVDIPTLRRALQILVDRHPSLRTKFLTRDADPVQQVQEQTEIDFEERDASALSMDELNEVVAKEAHVPFDIEHGPVFRARLFTCSRSEHVLLLVAHHIVIDGWSFWVLLDELREVYTAEKNQITPSLAALKFQYSDYVRWQSEMLAGPEGERLWNYWQTELSGDLPVLNLPTFRARPRTQTFHGASHAFNLGEDLTQRLKVMAKAEGATLYTALVAAFLVLLHRYSGQEEILIGSPATGRTHAEFEGIIGCFFSAVVLRANLSNDPPFNEFLQQVRATVLRALEHQDYPSHLLAQRLQSKRQAGQGQLFQTSFILQQPRRPAAQSTFEPNSETVSKAGDLALGFFPVQRRSARSELELELVETDCSLQAWWHYNTDIFEGEIITRMARHFQQLLEGIIASPRQRLSELPLLAEAEREELLVQWSGTHVDYSGNLTVHKLFEERAAKTPSKVAAVSSESISNFEELNKQANSLANLITELRR